LQRLNLSVPPKDFQHKDRRIALQAVMSAWVTIPALNLQPRFGIKFNLQVPLASSVLQVRRPLFQKRLI
jgi:hypothetical protein